MAIYENENRVQIMGGGGGGGLVRSGGTDFQNFGNWLIT